MIKISYLKFLSIALNKYRKLDHSFPGQENEEKFGFQRIKKMMKKRLIVKKGIEFIALKIEDVAMVYTENKIVYVVDSSGKKYFGDQPISEIEKDLDDQQFFRVNRQHLVNINYIKGFRSFEKVKLLVELELPGLSREIVISQETAPLFRQWIYHA